MSELHTSPEQIAANLAADKAAHPWQYFEDSTPQPQKNVEVVKTLRPTPAELRAEIARLQKELTSANQRIYQLENK